MADNITAPATGTVLSTDEIAGVHYPRTKIAFGADGSATDVSPDAPFPVSVAELPLASGASTAANQAALIELVDGIETLLGSLGTQETLAAILAKIVAAPSTEAKQDTIIGHVDGIEPALASILAKIIAAPATEAKQDSAIAAIATIGTRAYGAGQRVEFGATSAESTGLEASEVLLHASERCFIRVAAAATASAGIPLEAGEKFHLRLTSGQQIHVIRDIADGFLNIVPVA